MAATDRRKASAEHKSSRSLFDLPPDFFDSCRLLSSSIPHSSNLNLDSSSDSAAATEKKVEAEEVDAVARWTCNTCKSEFDSLQDQRSHFKSDLHRLNVRYISLFVLMQLFTYHKLNKKKGKKVAILYEILAISHRVLGLKS